MEKSWHLYSLSSQGIFLAWLNSIFSNDYNDIKVKKHTDDLQLIPIIDKAQRTLELG
jgi:hypothetical protein